MGSTSDQPRSRANRWTWLNVGLIIVVLPLVVIVGWNLFERYQHERKRAELASSGASTSRPIFRHAPGPIRGVTGVGQPVYDGEVVLLRKGEAFGAFIPLKQGWRGETVTFKWYYRTDGSGRLDEESAAISAGEGTVTGGRPTVSFGPFSFRWSHCAPGWGWLYYDRGEYESVEPTDLRICMTTSRSIDGLDGRERYYLYKASRSDVGIPGNEPCSQPD